MRIAKEIAKVGIRDWCWFVILLRRNEFHKRLDLINYYPDMDRLCRDRNRAHRIDNALAAHEVEG